MKKFLLPIALALAILLTLTSCDAIVDVLPEGIGNALQEMAPGVFGEKDDPEANIALIVSTINEGKDFESVLKEQEKEINIDEVLAELEAELAALTCEVNFKANADGEKVSGYGAIKDKVMYLAPDGEDEQGYIFIEDDYKLVAVSGSKETVTTVLLPASLLSTLKCSRTAATRMQSRMSLTMIRLNCSKAL